MVAKRRKNLNLDEFGPIPKNQLAAWNDLIERSRKAAGAKAKAQFDLIILAGEVETSYGEKSILRWAEETGISYASARQYRTLFNRGVDKAFIAKYSTLGYTVIRDVVFYCGGAANATGYLDYAKEHSLGPAAINAFMRQIDAPVEKTEEAAAHKMAVRMKQDLDGFSDQTRVLIEKVIEEHPEIEQEVLAHKIVKTKDLDELLTKAGIVSDYEQKMVDRSRRAIDRARKEWMHYRDQADDLKENIEYDHEASQELYDKVKYLHDVLTEILKSKPKRKRIPKTKSIDTELGPKTKVNGNGNGATKAPARTRKATQDTAAAK